METGVSDSITGEDSTISEIGGRETVSDCIEGESVKGGSSSKGGVRKGMGGKFQPKRSTRIKAKRSNRNVTFKSPLIDTSPGSADGELEIVVNQPDSEMVSDMVSDIESDSSNYEPEKKKSLKKQQHL